jgi:hypothetical protein
VVAKTSINAATVASAKVLMVTSEDFSSRTTK